MIFGWRNRWADFIQIRSSKLAAAIFIRKHVLIWPSLTLTASRQESEKRPCTGERAVDGRRRQRGRPAKGAADGDKRCNCQASVRVDGRLTAKQTTLHMPGSRRWASGQAARWVATNVRRPCGRTDEFYHYSDGSPMVRSVKQWDSNRAVWRPKTDDSSLVRSGNTAGRNGPSIKLSHGRFVAYHKINFHIKPEKRGFDLYESLAFFVQFGVKIWGSTKRCSWLVRDYIRYAVNM